MLKGVLPATVAAFLVVQVASAQTEWEQQVSEGIRVAGTVFSSEGYELTGTAHTGALNQGASEDFTVFLESGRSYLLVGVCDDDCPDIDLMLLDEAGREIDRDYQNDAVPIVRASPVGSGRYTVHVYMASCTTEPCYYGVGVLTRAPGAEAPAPTGQAAMVGRVERGRLQSGDYQLETGEYFDSYTFDGNAGEQVVIDLRSSDFDPYLILVTPDDEQFDNDDHEGSANRSLIALELPLSGVYDVLVTTYKPGESGAYDLRIDRPSLATASSSRSERGRLESGDEQIGSGEYVDGFQFEGVPGQRVRLDLSSEEFDTYLILVDPNGEHLENDDAEGMPGHSLIETQITEPGTYVVAVTSYEPGETGAYQLEMQFDAGARGASRQRDVQAIALGGTVSGRLESGDLQLDNEEYGDLYVFDANAGESVTIDMASTDFDTYLVLLTPSGEQIENDDFAGSRDRSRLELSLRESGRYRIIATSYGAEETGVYQVALAPGTSATQPAAVSTAAGRVYGVFMGISDYPGESSDLAYTAEDAERVRDAMTTAGMNAGDAIVLTDAAATVGNLDGAIRSLNHRMGPNDVFVLFYSGHGNRIPRSDFQPSDPDAMDETIELFDGPLTDDQLNAMLADLNAGTSLIVLDACFSGGFAKDVISAPGRMGLFSSEEDVTSSVAAKFRAGGYLAAFLADGVGEGLADGDGDGGVSALELSQYIHERYRADVKSAEPGEFVRTGGPQLGYQHLVVDRGSVGPYDVLFYLQRSR